ncbi:MAG: hypothetical protein AAF731_20365 [Bacteroidota bacterium]
MSKKNRPSTVNFIVASSALTITRAQAILFLPTLQMFGGASPDPWLGPWVTDSILGVILPIVIYFMLKGSGIKTWTLFIIYSVIGAFDYANGLVTQWLHPLPEEIAGAALVYGSLIASFTFQLLVVILLFRKDVMRFYIK